MNEIEQLLRELGQASMRPENVSYNDITEIQSSESYRMMIESLYNQAVLDVYKLPETQRQIVLKRINDVREHQLYFDVPTRETVTAMLRDYNAQPDGKRNKSLLNDYRYCTFVLECVAIQKDYLERFAAIVTVETSQETSINAKPDEDTVTDSNSDTAKDALKDKVWLNIEQTASFFGLSKNSLKSAKWRREHGFPTEDFEDSRERKTNVRFDKKEVEEWIKSNKKKRR